jgi:hypothetical protein
MAVAGLVEGAVRRNFGNIARWLAFGNGDSLVINRHQ